MEARNFALSLAMSCLSVGGLTLGENALGPAVVAFGIAEAVVAFRRLRESKQLLQPV